MLSLLAALLLVGGQPAALAGLALGPLPAGTAMELRQTPFPGLAKAPITVKCVVEKSGLTLSGPPAFGGLSALRFVQGTGYFLSDRGQLVTATLTRSPDGFVSGLADVRQAPLLGKDWGPLGKADADSEGVVVDGHDLIVSLENNHRIQRFSRVPDGWSQAAVLHRPDSKTLKVNKGLEALTRLADGRLVALAEGTNNAGQSMIAISATPDGADAWTQHLYKPAPDFAVTDADIDPKSGDLIVLERAFSRLRGPRARLVRVARAHLTDHQVVEGTELARLTFLHGVDNMEGIEVERTADGRLIAHMISDDNFNDIQRTVLIGLLINDTDPACAPPVSATDRSLSPA